MAVEIERRFLVAGDGWRQHVRWEATLRQGYLVSAADGLTLRVRSSCRAGVEEAWLTLKARPPQAGPEPQEPALSRLEFEYPIPLADAEELLRLSSDQLGKRRCGLALPGGDWVLDVFEGANAPLVIAEVELDRADRPVSPPAWCGREITGLHQLSNAALARRPLSQWSPDERRELLGVADAASGR